MANSTEREARRFEREVDPSDREAERFLSEPEMRAVLARAAELDDEQGARVSVAELARIATEAGISAAALSQALHELDLSTIGERHPDTTARVPDRSAATGTGMGSRWRTLLGLLGVGIVVGGTTAVLHGFVDTGYRAETLVALLLMCGLCLGFALDHHRDGALARYEQDASALWVGFAAGLLVLETSPTYFDQVLRVIIMLWATAALIGGFIVALGRESVLPEDHHA